jgi:hypothetical protein
MVDETLSVTEWTSVLKLAAMWQMERLLDASVERMRALEVHEQELEEWMKVLDLSATLELSAARALAIERLSSSREIEGVEMVLLARKYHVEEWLREGYEGLIHRDAFLSDEEGEILGCKTVTKLCRLRDGYSKSRIQHYANYRKGLSYGVTSGVRVDAAKIEGEFALEFQEIRSRWNVQDNRRASVLMDQQSNSSGSQ